MMQARGFVGIFRRGGAQRRGAFAAAIALLLGGVAVHSAAAQSPYPTKPIRIVVGFSAGGPADIIARVVGAKLGDILGQQVVIENRTGAGGTIATESVARAEPDGYTLLTTPLANAVNETLFKNLRYKVGEHLMAVAPLAETSNVLVVHPSLGVNSVPELIALAKAKPGEIFYASAGRGTATHLTSELFNMMAGVKLVPVHYRGGGETIKDRVRPGQSHVLEHRAGAGIREGWVTARARHHRIEARRRITGAADRRRSGHCGVRDAALDWACWHRPAPRVRSSSACQLRFRRR